MFANIENWMFQIWKNQKQNESATSKFFLVFDFFSFKIPTLFTLKYICKLPKSKKYGLRSKFKSVWEKIAYWRIVGHFSAKGELLHFKRFIFQSLTIEIMLETIFQILLMKH